MALRIGWRQQQISGRRGNQQWRNRRRERRKLKFVLDGQVVSSREPRLESLGERKRTRGVKVR